MTKLKIALLMSTAAFGFASAQSPARVTASTARSTPFDQSMRATTATRSCVMGLAVAVVTRVRAHRAAIEATAARMEGQFWLNSKAEDAKKLAILQEHGIEITQPSPELRAALLEKAKPLWDDFKARVPDAAPYVDAYLTARQ